MLKQSNYKIGCDAHKRFSMFAVLDQDGKLIEQVRIDHEPGAISSFLSQFPPDTPVAMESVGNWYWIVDEIESAHCVPLLAHAAKAKVMMGNVHKTDKLDAEGLGTLQHLGKLPAVWIAPAETRDQRELPRTRMAFSRIRTAMKNRMHSTLAKYALGLDTQSDIFAPKWRPDLLELFTHLPAETQRCMQQELQLLNQVQAHIDLLEERIQEHIQVTETMQLVKTLPGIGNILCIVIDLEVGNVDRFPSNRHLASYSGTVPRVKGSGGKYRYGRMVKQANNYLKWAYIEAANCVVRNRNYPNWRGKFVSQLYQRIRQRKGHATAVGAVARHLAEATFWVLRKGEPYMEPKKASPKQGQARG